MPHRRFVVPTDRGTVARALTSSTPCVPHADGLPRLSDTMAASARFEPVESDA